MQVALNQWLDVSITIYKQTKWRQGIGKINIGIPLNMDFYVMNGFKKIVVNLAT